MHHATTVHHFSPARRRNHLRIMSNEHPDTMAPETDREAPTNPEASRAAIPPPPTPSTIWELAYNKLLAVHEEQKQRDRDLFDPEGRFAQIQRDQRRELVRELADAVTPRIGKLEDSVAELRRAVDELRAKMTEERAAFEAKFSEQESNLAETNRVIADIEKQLQAKRDAAEPQAPAATD